MLLFFRSTHIPYRVKLNFCLVCSSRCGLSFNTQSKLVHNLFAGRKLRLLLTYSYTRCFGCSCVYYEYCTHEILKIFFQDLTQFHLSWKIASISSKQNSTCFILVLLFSFYYVYSKSWTKYWDYLFRVISLTNKDDSGSRHDPFKTHKPALKLELSSFLFKW